MFDNNFGNPKVQGIREIVLPDPVSYAPQTVGWWILLGVVGLLLAWWVYRRYIQWCGNRYRRQALMELTMIEEQLSRESEPFSAMAAVSALVKRTAIEAFGRSNVAELSGHLWLEFLDQTGSTHEFTQGAGRLLPEFAYARQETLNEMSKETIDQVLALVKDWIDQH
ncbi:MAG: DUF4381 domain-containing protein [Phycisphaerales bacterium]|nr:MAG: DUF4381 domain-containing protein [Phycisphaerales bacterium]